MPLFIKSVLQAKARQNRLEKSLRESSREQLRNSAARTSDSQRFEIFLSHSYEDEDAIQGLRLEFESLGHSVYVDWIVDPTLDRSRATKENADVIRKRMLQCKSLFFATSRNASQSVWMPWELGYFDGVDRDKIRGLDGKVAICPMVDDRTEYYIGQEYLGLYPYVSKDTVRGTSELSLWICRNATTYVNFAGWLSGTQPYSHP